VEAVGENVTDLRPGDEVFGSSWDGSLTTSRTFAEFAAVPASQLIEKPTALTFEEAAASVCRASPRCSRCATRAGLGRGLGC
jgi:NADPH:quinone reductase-like Zn-dependent oxidoreductase